MRVHSNCFLAKIKCYWLGDEFFIFGFGFHVVDRIGTFHLQMDGLCQLGLSQRLALIENGWIFVREKVRDFNQRMVEEDVVGSMEMKGSGLVDLCLEQKINHWERWKKRRRFICVFQILWGCGLSKEKEKYKEKEKNW